MLHLTYSSSTYYWNIVMLHVDRHQLKMADHKKLNLLIVVSKCEPRANNLNGPKQECLSR